MDILLTLALIMALPVPDGTIVFVENGNRIVQTQTDSTVTHVGVIVNIDGKPWMYEAVKPVVRKIKLADYYNELSTENQRRKIKYAVWLATPDVAFTDEQTRKMKEYLDGQLGKKYSLRSYVSHKPGEGIHCCELTGTALKTAGIDYTNNPCADGPFDVWLKTKPFYKNREEVILK